MNRLGKSKGILEILLVIGLILVIPLFFAIRSVANAPAARSTSTAYVPSVSVSQSNPSPSSPNNAKEPPACTFPLANITTTPSAPENYTFSEPKVVLTALQGNLYHIAKWLPDNQQVLMTEELGNNVPADQINPENIELLNPVTGDVKVYATRPSTYGLPSWDSALNAVLYPVDLNKTNNVDKSNLQLWVSYGNPDTAQMLAKGLSQIPIAVKPGGDEIIYLTDKQISKLDKSLKNISPSSFDPTQWDYAKKRRSNEALLFDMAWQPGTSLIFLYSTGYMGGGGYAFILNADTGQVCELNLGGWAFLARWSSNGQYLAISRSQEPTSMVSSTDLAVLDTVTGHLYASEVVPQELIGRHYAGDMAWAPDNRHLLVLGSAVSFPQCAPNCREDTKLYLVDFLSGQVDSVLPDRQFTANNPGTSLAWSPDSSQVIALCPALCSISVHRSGQ